MLRGSEWELNCVYTPNEKCASVKLRRSQRIMTMRTAKTCPVLLQILLAAAVHVGCISAKETATTLVYVAPTVLVLDKSSVQTPTIDITYSTSLPTDTSGTSASSSSSQKFQPGILALIVVGAVVLFAVLLIALFYFFRWRWKRNSLRPAAAAPANTNTREWVSPEPHGSVAADGDIETASVGSQRTEEWPPTPGTCSESLAKVELTGMPNHTFIVVPSRRGEDYPESPVLGRWDWRNSCPGSPETASFQTGRSPLSTILSIEVPESPSTSFISTGFPLPPRGSPIIRKSC
ncbi:hypothetical protein BDD12DRAFT_865344 [Trichophaea hybrida]|nr:hypothetical protein BDD12DRAFT_865344 [Trichophaea hybrida]